MSSLGLAGALFAPRVPDRRSREAEESVAGGPWASPRRPRTAFVGEIVAGCQPSDSKQRL